MPPITGGAMALSGRVRLMSSRGKQLVVLVGPKNALAIAVKNQGARGSKLTESLRNAPAVAPQTR